MNIRMRIHLSLIISGIVLSGINVQSTALGDAGTEIKTLINRIENGDQKAILELGTLGNKEVIPYLQNILLRPNKNFGGAAVNAQMALAKLGERRQLDEILSELRSDDPSVQDIAVLKLTYVGGKEAVNAFAKLLDDKAWRHMKEYSQNVKGPHGENPQDEVLSPPLRILAMKALSQIVPNPPYVPKNEPIEGQVRIWKEWLAQNGDLISR